MLMTVMTMIIQNIFFGLTLQCHGEEVDVVVSNFPSLFSTNTSRKFFNDDTPAVLCVGWFVRMCAHYIQPLWGGIPPSSTFTSFLHNLEIKLKPATMIHSDVCTLNLKMAGIETFRFKADGKRFLRRKIVGKYHEGLPRGGNMNLFPFIQPFSVCRIKKFLFHYWLPLM
jgi:hypothetical protein